MQRYSDRFAESTYEAEQPDALWIDGHADDALRVPAFVFHRLVALGRAYRLHCLGQLITYDAETRLDPVQAEGLAYEIEFLADIVRDPLLLGALPPVLEFVSRFARGPSSSTLVIDLES